MQQLDPRTLERLARIIVDPEGTFERSGRELEGLLRRCRWTDPPCYDGTYRVGWLFEAMEQRGAGSSDVERLICRVCDPLEYDDGMDSAEAFRQAVNEVLGRERLAVSYVGSRPVLGELSTSGDRPTYSAPSDLEERLRALVRDPRTAELLTERARETRICEANGAYTFAIIGIGSLIEGLLLTVLTEHVDEIRSNGFVKNGKRIDAQFVSFKDLIEIAHHHDLIQIDAKDFMDLVRDYRNFVHPRHQLAKRAEPDRDSVMLCWGPVRALLNDLEERLLERR